ncbi:NAD(P)-binding domain-containing protein [Rhodopila sp.]|uniref:NAD(P)-binding domain-containing protein n=1 Tax=Rhodopila sp. TaxID=2480087 RepID=UPI003D11C120
MTEIVDVAIIGAGPYGLSIAAHLAGQNVDFRIFGSPMHTWRTSMPESMVLKSEGNGSDIYDPAGELTLARFCADRGLPYKDIGFPIPLSTFITYGIAFQQRFVPRLEDRLVTQVRPTSYGFDIYLDDGEVAPARRLIVAAGIRSYEYSPPEFADLPPELATHSARHVRVDQFAEREVAVIGGGASAVNLAPVLMQAGARPILIARRPLIDYCGPPNERTLLDRIREPESGLGTGWRSWACCAMPSVFHAMPEAFRLMIVRKHLPAAPGWTLQPQVDGIVPTVVGATIARADAVGGRVRLELDLLGGKKRILTADHVIAGTGYRVDMRRLAFLGPEVLDRLDCVNRTPRLSRCFESSVPGLYFVGTAAANSFGPMMRFAYGAGFASRQISRHLARTLARGNVRTGAASSSWGKPTLAGT